MRLYFLKASFLALVLFTSSPAFSQETPDTTATETNEALLARIEKLEAELSDLRAAVLEAKQSADEASQASDTVVDRLETVERQAAQGAKGTYSGAKSDARWHLAGYADAGFVGGDMPGADSFVSGQFNPGFHFQYKDFLIFESELEFRTASDGETTTELEYSQFDFIVNDYLTFVAGKYLSPVGQFQERLHPSWINKIQGAPAGFGHDGVQPSSDTGIQVKGSIPTGKRRLTYALALGNGPRTTAEGGVALEGMASDDNSNKSLGGRIGFFPLPSLEVGASYLNARVNGYRDMSSLATIIVSGPESARYELWGADGAYTKGPVAVRAEYLNARRGRLFSVTDDDPLGVILPEMKMTSWYGQVSYRLANVGDSAWIHNLEPVIRYGQFRISGNDILEQENEQNRLNLGLNYWLAPTIVTRAGLEWRDFKLPGTMNETLYKFQIAYGF